MVWGFKVNIGGELYSRTQNNYGNLLFLHFQRAKLFLHVDMTFLCMYICLYGRYFQFGPYKVGAVPSKLVTISM